MLANSNAAPRTIQLALGSYSVTATYTGTNTFGESDNGSPSVGNRRPAPAAPIVSPSSGRYMLPQLISIFSSDPDATIYYVVNYGPPTKYTAPIPLRGADTIQAVAIVESNGKYLESPVAVARYTAVAPPPAPPVMSPAGGTFRSPQTVIIQPATTGSTIYYSVNGEAAQRYTGPITVAAKATIQAVAIGNFGALFAESPVVIGDFEILP